MLAHGLIGAPNKAELSELLRTGKSNREVALWLSRAYPDIIETMELETGDTADYRTIPEGIELEVLDADEKRLATCCSSAGMRLHRCCAGYMPASWTALCRSRMNRIWKPPAAVEELCRNRQAH
ncbi:MAG: hypothetical protein ACLU9S_01545 [Oscillospiraceae bacterium]